MLILIGRGLDLRKPAIVRKEDSRSILCGFEGADDGSVKRGSEVEETKRSERESEELEGSAKR